MASTSGPSWGLPCPVCGRPSAGPGPAPCPSCGLPAVGEAARVVARIGATIDELVRDRDRLLATLRTAAAPPTPVPAAAPPTPVPAAAPPLPVPAAAPVPGAAAPAPPAPAAPPPPPAPAAPPPPPAPAAAPAPGPPAPAPPAPVPAPSGRPPRGVSPQQVLLGLGALLVVAAGIAFVAVAWTRLGLAF